MIKKSTSVLIFLAGAVVGSISSYFITKNIYDKRCEHCGDKNNSCINNDTKIVVDTPKTETNNDAENNDISVNSELNDYLKVVEQYKYTSPESFIKPSDNLEDDDHPSEEYERSDTPYVISPEEFGENDDYDTVSLMYYADQIVADDNDDIIEDIEGTIGFDSLNHFGDYETDAVHVRNDEKCTDYEILRSLRTYKEVAAQRGIIMED